MAQSATTVTTPNPTPPTNLSFVGATPPLDPAQAVVDDGWVSGTSDLQATRILFAVKTAAAGAGTSVDAEGRGNETSFTQSYSTSIYAPFPLVMDGCGPALAAAPAMPNPNQNHASSLSPATNPTLTTIAPTTSVHGTGQITMTATGVGFTRQSRIVIGGVVMNTTFVSSTSLTCLVTPPVVTPAPPAVPVIVRTGGVVDTAAQNWTIT